MVISTVNQVVYNGDGVTTAFPFTFRIIEATDIKLLLIDADGAETDISADYYVDTVNNTVYYPGYAPGAEPPAEDQPPKVQTGQKLVVYRELPITQEKDLGEKWPFYVIELGLDKLTMILQQIFDWWGRTLKISQGGSVDGFDTNIYPEAGKVIAVNEDGDGFEAKTAMLEENNAWEGKGMQIHNIAGPSGVTDAVTKDYVDQILNGFVLSGDSRTVPVDTLIQLRALDIDAGQIAFTLGYHDVNDGGAGVYNIRTATLSDVDNGGTIIILDNGNVAELITDGTVRPEQFGAYGDNTHDDTTALQNMIDTYKIVHSLNRRKVYKTSAPLIIPKLDHLFVLLGTIWYTGNDYAVKFTCESTSDGTVIGRVSDCEVEFGNITAPNGGCIAFYPKNGNYGFVSGLRLSGRVLYCLTNCIYVYSLGWFNENKISNFNCSYGANAFYLVMPADAANTDLSRDTFDRVHIEGTTNGVYLETNDHNFNGIYFMDCRMNEAIDEYFVKVKNINVTQSLLMNNIINIIGTTTAAKFKGDAIYAKLSEDFITDSGSIKHLMPSQRLIYNGLFLTVPLEASQRGYTIPEDASIPIEIDISTNLQQTLLLRSNFSTGIVNLTVPALPFGFMLCLPMIAYAGTWTINITTKSETKTLTLVSAGTSTRYFLYVDYYYDVAFIK